MAGSAGTEEMKGTLVVLIESRQEMIALQTSEQSWSNLHSNTLA